MRDVDAADAKLGEGATFVFVVSCKTKKVFVWSSKYLGEPSGARGTCGRWLFFVSCIIFLESNYPHPQPGFTTNVRKVRKLDEG